MAQITIANLLTQIQVHYNFGILNPGEKYLTKIVDSVIRPNSFQGTSLRLIFEIIEGQFVGTHISHILTAQQKDERYSQSFVNLIGLFFDLNNPNESFDVKDLVGKTCQILVENNKPGSRWQKVTEILIPKES